MARKGKRQSNDTDPPLYRRVKEYIAERILDASWAVGTRIPSENDLTEQFSVSRMTVNRALRELTDEGLLHRIKGAGTYVAEPKPQSALLEIRNLREEIIERGHKYSCEVLIMETVMADRQTARALDLAEGSTVFHSLVLQMEDDVPVELEDRHVNPAFAPDYFMQDFTRITTFEYLDALGPMTKAERSVDAVLPDRRQQKHLRIGPREPCLLVKRRTWCGDLVVGRTSSLLPGSRYRLFGVQTYS
ncbi:histidine utilization repressor [Limibacillus sp. MBR-115]|uniref:histidine utilization repressor n=1 Tax=Limibacillus sp. MBR-115 TaxID=3156465 RepID=UPI0033952F68